MGGVYFRPKAGIEMKNRWYELGGEGRMRIKTKMEVGEEGNSGCQNRLLNRR